MTKFLTAQQVADRLQVTPATVKRWLREGQLPGVMLGDRAGWRVAEADLDAYLRAQGNAAYGENRSDEGEEGKAAA